MATTKILLVDDHKVFREGIRSLIEQEEKMEVVAEADNGRTALSLIDIHHPEVVIMDASMPEMNGINATQQIIHEHPDIKVLGLSMHSDQLFVNKMFAAGVNGYLLKDCTYEQIHDAINSIIEGKVYLSPQICTVIVNEYVDFSETTVLTSREKEITQLLSEGKSTKDIAHTLYISIKTVESHRQRIMKKLGMNTLAELIKYAIKEGYTSL